MSVQLKKLDLLLKEIDDPVVQENFWRIKQAFEAGQLSQAAQVAAVVAEDPIDYLGRYHVFASEEIEIPVGYENVVTATQTVDGVLTVLGRNTIL